MQIALLPTSSERLSISQALLFTRDQTQRGNNNNATERKVKTVKVNGANYGGNMEQSPMTFTSDVSLPKDDNNYAR